MVTWGSFILYEFYFNLVFLGLDLWYKFRDEAELHVRLALTVPADHRVHLQLGWICAFPSA